MKRPIAELLIVALNAGAEAERMHVEHEIWQILRRKQGYVTHRLYCRVSDPLQRLVYSEWESTKAVDGARRHLQGTPLMRRARAALAAPPQRWALEITGPITSTKGLDLPGDAVAVSAVARLKAPMDSWRPKEQEFWKVLAAQPGHITHVLLHGIEDRSVVGSFSHWDDAGAFQRALDQIDSGVATGVGDALAHPVDYILLKALQD
jgi:heme-degrading monooxygenase HmoA